MNAEGDTRSLNRFIEPIMRRRKRHDYKAHCLYKNLMRQIDSMSPSFYTLWEIHDFLKLLRYCYMYNNDNEHFHLFLATPPKANRKYAAMIYKEEGFQIKFVLVKPDNEICIEITRHGQSMNETEQIRFIDGEYEFKDDYDAEKFLFITSSLMNSVKELVTYYYNNKRF